MSILAGLILMNFLFQSEKLDPIYYEPEYLGENYQSITAYICPNNSDTHKIGEIMGKNYNNYIVRYFNDSTQMKKAYLADSTKPLMYSSYFGIEFFKKTFPMNIKSIINGTKNCLTVKKSN